MRKLLHPALALAIMLALPVHSPAHANDSEAAIGLGGLIGECLTEVNVTSPTCFVEIAEQTGFDVADTFIAALGTSVAQV